jgi:uncharacterized protein involved in outer membrane biogenesis
MTILKRLLLVLFSLVLLIVATIAVIPLFVDIDQYRPEIVRLINQRINGEAQIGELSLSLWGEVEIEISDVKVTPQTGEPVLELERAYAYFPFGSLLEGRPHLTLSLDEPLIRLVKRADGQLNVLNLLKLEQAAADSAPEDQSAEPDKPVTVGPDNRVLALLLASSVDLEIVDADVRYQDAQSDVDQKVDGLNLQVRDISFNQPLDLEMWANLDTKIAGGKISGPVRLTGVVEPEMRGSSFEKAAVRLNVNLDELTVALPETLKKSANDALHMSLQGELMTNKLQIESLDLQIMNAPVKAQGTLQWRPDLTYEFVVQSERFDLSAWQAVVLPMDGLLRSPANLALDTQITTDHIKNLQLDLQAPDTDLKLMASVKNFAVPQVKARLESKQINLNKLLVLAESEVAAKPAADAGDSSPSKAGSPSKSNGKSADAAATDLDKTLAELTELETVQGATAVVNVVVGKLIYDKLVATDIQLDLNYRRLKAKLERLALKVFEGQVGVTGQFDLTNKIPSYGVDLSIDQIDIKQAVQTQFESFADTLLGQLSVTARGSGQSLNPSMILPNLDITGRFQVKEATFATVDVAKMVNESVQKAIESVRQKYPQLPEWSPKSLKGQVGRYKQIASDFRLQKGTVRAPGFLAEPYPNKGVTIKGDTEMGLIDDHLQAEWRVIDTYELTDLKDVDLKVGGTTIKSILAKEGEPVWLPIEVGCKLSSPCYRYGAIPQHFVEIAGERVKKEVGAKLQGKAKKEIEKKKKELEETAKDKVKDLLKGKKLPF